LALAVRAGLQVMGVSETWACQLRNNRRIGGPDPAGSQGHARTPGQKDGKALHAQRWITALPAFGNIKANLKFRRFSRRGQRAAFSEWRLICSVHNLLKVRNAFADGQTVIDPTAGTNLIKAAPRPMSTATPSDATMSINGDTEFTGQNIRTIGVLNGALRTDILTRTVRTLGIGVQAGDVYTIGSAWSSRTTRRSAELVRLQGVVCPPHPPAEPCQALPRVHRLYLVFARVLSDL
jgi:hypothetical protein